MNKPRCRSAAGAHEAGPGGRAPASPVPPSHTPLNTIALTSPTQTPRPAAQPGLAAREMRPDRGASRGAPHAPVPSPTEQLRGGDFWHTAYIYGENKQGTPARLADVRSGEPGGAAGAPRRLRGCPHLSRGAARSRARTDTLRLCEQVCPFQGSIAKSSKCTESSKIEFCSRKP